MTYNVSLSHEDFVLVLDVLRKCEESGLVNWSATDLICENTTIKY